MSERPFMQLYVSDFVGDTLLLSTEHIGAYLLLLIALWNAGGVLPSDEKKLARCARMTVKKWRTASVELAPFFIVENDSWSHGRLTKELQKVARQSDLRASAGAKGGAATALKTKGSRPANATAKGVARLQHLPEPYKKEGNLVLVGEASEASILLDRIHDADMFEACEAIQGEKVADYLQKARFPVSVVAKAKAKVAA